MWVCIAVYFILGMVCIVLRYRKLLIHYDKKLWKTIFYVMFCAATIALLTEISDAEFRQGQDQSGRLWREFGKSSASDANRR